ncbi:MAG: hypothetical protein ACLUDU_13345, partial [Butyricimonas faecihominis]
MPALDGVFNTREGIALAREMNESLREIVRLQWDFIKANPNSTVAIDVARDMMYRAKLSKTEMDNLLQIIDTSLHDAPAYEALKESMKEFYPVAIGEMYK